MPASCLVVVAPENDHLAEALRDVLESRLGQAPLVVNFHTVQALLHPESDGLLVVVHPGRERAADLAHFIQDIALQKFPSEVVVVEAGDDHLPAALALSVRGRFRWPAQAAQLAEVAAEFVGCRYYFQTGSDTPLQDRLRRLLQVRTPSLLHMADRIALAASHDVTVLLTGETGTGKTYFARLIHDLSPRKEHRFLHISCGAITANLVESEFFGHVKGSFTGADRNKVGKFAAVGKGTLLLDEIDTLGLEQQATLLRVIETGEFEPVGSVDTQRCEARLIVASNILLEDAVDCGKFRKDLYYRLNMMSFHLQPLRERVQDIASLARMMAARFNRKFNKNLFDISPQAMSALESYPWPGNIRQLENAIQHAALVSDGPEILLKDLPDQVKEYALVGEDEADPAGCSLFQQRDLSERNAIRRALIQNGYNRSRTADSLGISRVTLYKKMQKFGLLDIPIHPPGEAESAGD